MVGSTSRAKLKMKDSKMPGSAPIALVKEQSKNQWQLCADYRHINKLLANSDS